MVRIRPIIPNLPSAYRVNEKASAEEFQSQLDQQQKDSQKDQEPVEVTDESVANALEAFSQDQDLKSKGLSAESLGQGPGLRVVLKDGSGRVVRQLSGEEFLKLREALDRRGKLLDQKI